MSFIFVHIFVVCVSEQRRHDGLSILFSTIYSNNRSSSSISSKMFVKL